MKHTEEHGTVWYAVHEYYPSELFDEGESAGWTQNPVDVTGDSVEDVVWSLKAMLHDIEKHGVKDYD